MNARDMNCNESDLDKHIQTKRHKIFYDPVTNTYNYFFPEDKGSGCMMRKHILKEGLNISRQLARKDQMRERLQNKLEAKKSASG